MTTIALAERFRVCRSCLSAGLPDRNTRGMSISDLLYRVLGNAFQLMEEYEDVWSERHGTKRAGLFGYPHEADSEAAPPDVKPMLAAFRRGCRDLSEIWSLALDRETLDQVLCLARSLESGASRLRFPDDLWVRVVCGFAWAHKSRPAERAYLLRSLAPLYLAGTASFVIDTAELCSADVDGRVEDLCLCFERYKPELVRHWWRRAAPAWNSASANPYAPETDIVETKAC